MSFARSLRIWKRQLAITGAVAMNLDTFERWRECRELAGGAALIRVLYLHATPLSHTANLRRHLRWLQEQFRIIDFQTFDRICTGAAVPDRTRTSLLLTFDDGLASNYTVAAPLLEEFGLRGVFFVVPGFSLRSGDAAHHFCRERIQQTRVETAMTPGQIADLAARGHTIGNHTFTHANLLEAAPAEYDHEILESAAVIESWTGQQVHAFAWPFRWKAITPAAYRLAADRHRYCFAPCAGRTRADGDSRAPIWRTHIEAHFRPAEVRFQCSGLADVAASSRRRRLSRLLPSADVDVRRPFRRSA